MRFKPLNVCLGLGLTLCALLFALTLNARLIDHRHGPTVRVGVQATDASGATLHYQWKSTDGSINNVDSPTTLWTLPAGPGIHFAYVLVSNGLGGYTERRILVNTDTIGTQQETEIVFSNLIAPPSPGEPGQGRGRKPRSCSVT